jgi:hypothetical protein
MSLGSEDSGSGGSNGRVLLLPGILKSGAGKGELVT